MDADIYEKLGYLEGNCRLFCLTDREMRSFEYHYHDFDKILVFVSGNVSYMVEGMTYHLMPFDIVFIPHGSIHRPLVAAGAPYERYILYISPDWYQNFYDKEYIADACFSHAKSETEYVLHTKLTKQDSLKRLFAALKEATELFDTGRGTPEEAEAALLTETALLQLLIFLNRGIREGYLTCNREAVYDEKILAVISYLQENYAKELTVEQIASAFYISRFHLMRKFKEETGYTLYQYLTSKRLLAARDMLRKGEKAYTAAALCGFKDYSTFARSYHKQFGHSPKEKV